jgi:3'(2'), 5'-bisphosphate nucleotidase
MENDKVLLDAAQAAAFEAGKAIMQIYSSEDFGEDVKADHSPVTRADKAAHETISQMLLQTGIPILSEEGSDIPFSERAAWQRFWLVDPLDGTKEFIKRNGEFTVNIALIENGKPVMGVIYSPCLELMYAGSTETSVIKIEKNQHTTISPKSQLTNFETLLEKDWVTIVASRSHSSEETTLFIKQFKNVKEELSGSSLKFMALVEGKADIYPRLSPTMEWDTAAAHAILSIANIGVYQTDLQSQLSYNKPLLTNPFFVAF